MDMVGGWPTHLKNHEWVNWEDYSQYMEKLKSCSKPPTKWKIMDSAWEKSPFLWPSSMTMLHYQRVYDQNHCNLWSPFTTLQAKKQWRFAKRTWWKIADHGDDLHQFWCFYQPNMTIETAKHDGFNLHQRGCSPTMIRWTSKFDVPRKDQVVPSLRWWSSI